MGVVYDAVTGQIQHLHRVVTFVGGREPSEDEIAADALRAVSKLRRPHQGDRHALHLDTDTLEPNRKYRVDPATKVLVTDS